VKTHNAQRRAAARRDARYLSHLENMHGTFTDSPTAWTARCVAAADLRSVHPGISIALKERIRESLDGLQETLRKEGVRFRT